MFKIELRALREENLDLERRNELLMRDLQRTEEKLEKEIRYGHEIASVIHIFLKYLN
jgi:hypothetical protein